MIMEKDAVVQRLLTTIDRLESEAHQTHTATAANENALKHTIHDLSSKLRETQGTIDVELEAKTRMIAQLETENESQRSTIDQLSSKHADTHLKESLTSLQHIYDELTQSHRLLQQQHLRSQHEHSTSHWQP